MILPNCYQHPAPLLTIVPQLLAHLPYSLPLLRRLQFHASNPDALAFATYDPAASSQVINDFTFAAAYVERSRAPETECWIFCSYESKSARATAGLNNTATKHDAAVARLHLLAALDCIAKASAEVLSEDALTEVSIRTSQTGASASRHKCPLLVVGSLNEVLVPLLAGSDLRRLKPVAVLSRDLEDQMPWETGAVEGNRDLSKSWEDPSSGGVLCSISIVYKKYLIPPPILIGVPPRSPSKGRASPRASCPGIADIASLAVSAPKPAALPKDYTITRDISASELRTVISRTKIPRREETLAQLAHVGIRHGSSAGPLVAWAFLGPDGSLSSLHVEPQHRGIGLAKAICKTLFGQLASQPRELGFRDLGAPNVDIPGNITAKATSTFFADSSNINSLRNANPAAAAAEAEQEYPKGDFWGPLRVLRGIGWAHSDVAEDNVESAGVARGLGGRVGWKVRWVAVHLDRVREVCHHSD